MISSPEPDAQEAVRKVIHDINAAWINGHPENIAGRLHEHVVMIQPGFRGRAAGREASVNSYRDFCDQATIHDFKQSDPEIDVFGSTAVATYRFEIPYEIGGNPCTKPEEMCLC